MKIKIQCTYGDYPPGSVIDVDDKTAKKLIKNSNAERFKENSEPVNIYEKQIEVLKQEASRFNEDKQELLKKIELLDGLVQEAISLPKGQVPDGYKKAEL